MQTIYYKNLQSVKSPKKDALAWVTPFYVILFSLLLFIRDCGGIGINKYLFVVLTFVVVCTLDIKKTLCLFCFLMPLYVGLPGNYMTFIFFGKFLFEWKNFNLSPALFISTMFASIFVFLQNVIFGTTSIGEMSTIPGLIIVMFLFAYKGDLNKKSMITYYVVGVAITGLIMLFTTLNEFSFSEILTSTNRLGAGYNKTELFGLEGDMLVSLDPNYFGLFAIAAISVGYPLLFAKEIKSQKVILIISLLTTLAVALIGLSRAFLLVLIIWAISIIFTQMNFRNILIAIFTFVIVGILVMLIFPEVIEALSERFKSDDIADGNGRIVLIETYAADWTESFSTIIFGMGLNFCEVHCMPLQVVYGGGIVYSIIMIAFFLSLLANVRVKNEIRKPMDCLPMLLVFVMTCTVPIATSLTFMFPFVMSIYSLKEGTLCVSEL